MASSIHHRPTLAAISPQPRPQMAAAALAPAGPRRRAGDDRVGIQAAAALLLLTLAGLGCSTSPDDESGPAIEEPSPTTQAAVPTTTAKPDQPPTTTQPEQPEPALATATELEPPPAATRPEEPEPAPTTATELEPPPAATRSEEPGPALATAEPATPDDDETRPEGADGDPANDEASAGVPAESESSLETAATAIPPDLTKVQLLPWGGGFLNLGYLRADERDEAPCYASRLRIRTSDDGLQWTEFSDLEIPSIHAMPADFSGHDDFHIDCRFFRHRFPLHIASDGKRLAVVSQWPIGLETWAGVTSRSAALLDTARQIRPAIYLSVTEDLVAWDTIEIPIDPPEDLHESLHTEPHVTDLSLHDDRWLILLSTLTYMNFFALVPDDIRDSAAIARPDFGGAWHDERSGEEGVTIEWSPHDNPYAIANTRFVSWDELGITQWLFDVYGPNNQAYPLSELYSSSILTAGWGEDPKHSRLPNDNKFSHVVSTDAGYIALSDPSEAGYHPGWFGSGTLFFSADGEAWATLSRLHGDEVWVSDIRGVNGGVIALGSPSPGSAAFYEDEETSYYWLGTPDGSDWQPLDVSSFTGLMDWLIEHDRKPIGWPGLAAQGNIVLWARYDASGLTSGGDVQYIGSIHRHVAPE